jgi:DNA-binding LacI/PurR family transcriptional regulator
VTPPTAVVVDEVLLFVATQQFLARRRLRVPEEVSLVCLDANPVFEWCRPSVAHVRWDQSPVLRRVVEWAKHVASNKRDLRETLTRAEFIDGGTIGRAMR